jgi:hypothetical protein
MNFLDKLQELIYVILTVLIAVIIPLIIHMLNHHVKQTKEYLNDLGTATQTQIRSDLGRLQRFHLINNLSVMKKYVGISIVLLVGVICAIGSLVIYDSRTYFKEYFEVQRTKLNLRSEASVDSLVFIINKQQKSLDSLEIANSSNSLVEKEKIRMLEKSNQEMKNLIKIYQNEFQTKK